jgi:hypothetical protein
MQSFSLKRDLTSYEVNPALLKRIETYLFKKVPALTNIEFKPTEPSSYHSFFIEITDAMGTEKLNSINDYLPSLFTDSTNEISVSLSADHKLSININFNKNKLFSTIRIDSSVNNAKEIALAIYGGIIGILDPFKTTNKYYYPPPFIDGFISVVPYAFFGAAIAFILMQLYGKGIMALSLALVVFYYNFIGKRFNPYTLFDTNKSRNLRRWSSWFLYGLLGFIVFNLALPFILKIFGI